MSYPTHPLHSHGKSARWVEKTCSNRVVRFHREADTALLFACKSLAGVEPGDTVSCSAVCRRAVILYADHLKNPQTNFDAEMRLVREHTKMSKKRKKR